MLLFLPPLAAVLTTLLVIAVLLLGKAGNRISDIPNERSLHAAPIPRIGGIGLVAGIAAGWALYAAVLVWWVAAPLLALFAVSLFDDIHGLPVRLRLIVHAGAAIILAAGSGSLAWGVLPALAVTLSAIWAINLYNFMDGSDGLAGGMAISGFSAYGIAALMQGNEPLAVLNFSISAAAFGFLCYNFHPAKIFMGDAGSIPLGFLASAMGLWGWQQGLWPAWFPLLVFSPFVADATVTLLKRALRGERVWKAHREHYYQRLVQIGWGHRNVALFAYVLMFAAGISALWGVRQADNWRLLLFFGWSAVYLILMRALDMRWQAFQRRKQHG